MEKLMNFCRCETAGRKIAEAYKNTEDNRVSVAEKDKANNDWNLTILCSVTYMLKKIVCFSTKWAYNSVSCRRVWTISKQNKHRHENHHMSLVLVSYFLLTEQSPGVQLSLSFCDISRVVLCALCFVMAITLQYKNTVCYLLQLHTVTLQALPIC